MNSTIVVLEVERYCIGPAVAVDDASKPAFRPSIFSSLITTTTSSTEDEEQKEWLKAAAAAGHHAGLITNESMLCIVREYVFYVF